MIGLWMAVALAAGEREAHTVEMGVGALPACRDEASFAPCKLVGSALVHGDHRLARKWLVSWQVLGERRSWLRDGEAHITWRAHAAIGLGIHREWDWGDMRLYGGPLVELSHVQQSSGAPGFDWLDPTAQIPGWLGAGLWVGNDLDWPIGSVRLGFRWRIAGGADVYGIGRDSVPEALHGVDFWELHALSVALPSQGPLGFYAELGWINQFTVPFRQPAFRVSPWLTIGAQWRSKALTP